MRRVLRRPLLCPYLLLKLMIGFIQRFVKSSSDWIFATICRCLRVPWPCLIFVRMLFTFIKKAIFRSTPLFVPLLTANSSFHPIHSHSSGSAADHDSDGAPGISFVLSHFPSDTIQISLNPLAPANTLLRPRFPCELATFNMQTLLCIGQQERLARALEVLAIDVCCIQGARIKHSSSYPTDILI